MKNSHKQVLRTVVLTVLGNLCYALMVKLFLLPAGLPVGGTTGLALLMQAAFGIPISTFVLLFNIAMLLLGLVILGKKFAATTVLSSFFYPAALEMFNQLLGDLVLTDDLVLCAIFAGLGIGLSLGVVIRAGASTGGMDIPPLVLNRLLKIPVSVSLYTLDCLILLLQLTVNPSEMILYGILLELIISVMLDKVLLMGTSRTEIKIISDKSEEIRAAILGPLDRGVTLLTAEGGYSAQPKQLLLSVVSNRELPRLEQMIHEIDPYSFMVVSRVTEVKGRGFNLPRKYPREQ